MYCANCGKHLPDDALFCGACGTRVKKLPDEEATAVNEPLSEDVSTPEDAFAAEAIEAVRDDAAVEAAADVAAASEVATGVWPAVPAMGKTASVAVPEPAPNAVTGSAAAGIAGASPTVFRPHPQSDEKPAFMSQAPKPPTLTSETGLTPPAVAQERQQPKEAKSRKGLIIGLVVVIVVLVVALIAVFAARGCSSEPTMGATSSKPGAVATNTGSSSSNGTNASNGSNSSNGSSSSSSNSGSSSSSGSANSSTSSGNQAGGEKIQSQADEYMLPDSATHLYTRAELEKYSDYELYIARNEIFARHGRGFKNQDLQAYFDGKSWYTKKYSPEEFDAMPSPLNDTERKNSELMLKIEKDRGSKYLN